MRDRIRSTAGIAVCAANLGLWVVVFLVSGGMGWTAGLAAVAVLLNTAGIIFFMTFFLSLSQPAIPSDARFQMGQGGGGSQQPARDVTEASPSPYGQACEQRQGGDARSHTHHRQRRATQSLLWELRNRDRPQRD